MATTITTTGQMSDIAQSVGQKYGFDRVSAEFTAYADFKVRWTRSYKWADFTVSDYLKGADAEVIKNLFEVLFARITGTTDAPEYSDKFRAHVLSRDFVDAHKEIYLGRKRANKTSFRKINGTTVHWAKKENASSAGYASTLMNTIVLNPILKDAPEEVVDVVIAHEYNIIQDGLSNFGAVGEPVHCDEKIADDWLVGHNLSPIGDYY